jgi:hypothetical protein
MICWYVGCCLPAIILQIIIFEWKYLTQKDKNMTRVKMRLLT